MKQYVFTIDSDEFQRELIISANGILDAVAQVKLIMKVTEQRHQKKNLKFIGVKY
ncbi:hypothetical protein ACFFIX_03880 [Metabacillus herbersteinensis]|uniref:Uncharacterized protein n=1 Tax=Metabacillus herbersteinensis TaxID=283816 RepID=A0ABV6GBK3_9BACI